MAMLSHSQGVANNIGNSLRFIA